jgi:cell division septum initiation protein DivIVA
LNAEETEFPVAIRGYDKATVDDAIKDLRKEILTLSAQNSTLASELREATESLNAAKHELSEFDRPTYSGVGTRAALILSSAEEQAAHILNVAKTEAERQRHNLQLEVDSQRHEAKGYYDSLVAEAQRRADRIIAGARADYDEIIKKAHNDALGIVEEAGREASSIRGAVATEVAKMRAAAKREVELLKTAVERDLSERKMIAARELNRDLDVERANSLVTEQARIDLELELTARRNEAEQEYLRKHQEAVATTQKYLDDANSQLSVALTRANAARLEAEALEAAAISINQQTTAATRVKADGIIAAAEAEARTQISDAQAKISAELKNAEAELMKIKAERDSIEVYIERLRNVLNDTIKKA